MDEGTETELSPIGPQTTYRRKPAFRIEPSQFDILKNIFASFRVTPALFLSSADHSTILEKLNDVQGGAPLLAAHAAHTVEFRKRVDAKYGEWLGPEPAQAISPSLSFQFLALSGANSTLPVFAGSPGLNGG